MSKRLAALAGLVVLSGSPVYAEQFDAGWYVQFLGGMAAGTTVSYVDTGVLTDVFDSSNGYAVAGVVGYQILDNLSVELDALHTTGRVDLAYPGYTYGLTTTSLMAGLRYALDVSDRVAFYAGAAVGGIMVTDTWWDDTSSGLAYQVKVGAEVSVTDEISLVGELRHQAPLGDLRLIRDTDVLQSFSTTTALAGLKFGF